MLSSNSFFGSPDRQPWPKTCLNGFFVCAPLGYSLCVTLAGALSLQVLGLAVPSLYFQLLQQLNFLITAISYNPQAFFWEELDLLPYLKVHLLLPFCFTNKKPEDLHCANYLVCQSYLAPVRNLSPPLVGEGSMVLNCILQLSQVKSIFMPSELKPKKITPTGPSCFATPHWVSLFPSTCLSWDL